MELTPAVNDFDYTIHDSRGIVGVKNGKEYPVSKEEWKKAYPEHGTTDCKECTFAQDAKTILTFFVSRELKEQAAAKPVFVGKFTMSGWVGHSGFYVFRCSACDSLVVDYPHGYHGELCYLRCGECHSGLDLTDKEVYERENLHVPLLVRLNSMTRRRKRKFFRGLRQRIRNLS